MVPIISRPIRAETKSSRYDLETYTFWDLSRSPAIGPWAPGLSVASWGNELRRKLLCADRLKIPICVLPMLIAEGFESSSERATRLYQNPYYHCSSSHGQLGARRALKLKRRYSWGNRPSVVIGSRNPLPPRTTSEPMAHHFHFVPDKSMPDVGLISPFQGGRAASEAPILSLGGRS